MDKTPVFAPALVEAHELEEDDGGLRCRAWPLRTRSPNSAARWRAAATATRDEVASPSELKDDEQGRVFVDHLGIWFTRKTTQDHRLLGAAIPGASSKQTRKCLTAPASGTSGGGWATITTTPSACRRTVDDTS